MNRRWTKLVCLSLAGTAVACQPATTQPVLPPPAATSATSTAAPVTSAPPVTPTPLASTASRHPTAPLKKTPQLRLIEDDVSAARKLAMAEEKVLFVEVWAPWCHTCLSMKHYVLPSPAVVALQERAVFAAVDSDRDANADFLSRYDVAVWPTLFVLDPATEKVLGMWQGAASASEIRDLVNNSADARAAAQKPDGPYAALVKAKQAQAKRRFAQARSWYQKAQARGGPSWPRRSEALYGEFFCFYRQKLYADCVDTAQRILPEIRGAARPGDTAAIGLACASRLKDATRQRALANAVVRRLSPQLKAPATGSSVDDRSDAAATLARAFTVLGKPRAARRTTEFQLSLLERAAKKAGTPKRASVFDYARMGALLRLGRWPEAEALLKKRMGQLPTAYEPRARLAQVYRHAGLLVDALDALRGAIARAYGPRRVGYLKREIALLRALARKREEQAAIAKTIKAIEALPKNALPRGVERRKQLGRLRQRLQQLAR